MWCRRGAGGCARCRPWRGWPPRSARGSPLWSRRRRARTGCPVPTPGLGSRRCCAARAEHDREREVLQLHLGLTRRRHGASRPPLLDGAGTPSTTAPAAGLPRRPALFHGGGAGVRNPRHFHPEMQPMSNLKRIMMRFNWLVSLDINGKVSLRFSALCIFSVSKR
jgi:hypothetical protein